jgi:ribonuclease HI
VEGTGAGIYGQSVGRRLSISLGEHATVFQAEVYAILACVHEIETQDRPKKYVSVCSDSQVALKALQAAIATSPLVRQCQKALNNISTGTLWGCTGFLDMLGYEETKSLTSSQGTVLFKRLLEMRLSWGL